MFEKITDFFEARTQTSKKVSDDESKKMVDAQFVKNIDVLISLVENMDKQLVTLAIFTSLNTGKKSKEIIKQIEEQGSRFRRPSKVGDEVWMKFFIKMVNARLKQPILENDWIKILKKLLSKNYIPEILDPLEMYKDLVAVIIYYFLAGSLKIRPSSGIILCMDYAIWQLCFSVGESNVFFLEAASAIDQRQIKSKIAQTLIFYKQHKSRSWQKLSDSRKAELISEDYRKADIPSPPAQETIRKHLEKLKKNSVI